MAASGARRLADVAVRCRAQARAERPDNPSRWLPKFICPHRDLSTSARSVPRMHARESTGAPVGNGSQASIRNTMVSGSTPSWSIAAAASSDCMNASSAAMSATSATRAT